MLKIELKVRHVKYEDGDFDAYKVYSKKLGWIDCKFVKEIEKDKLPKENCYILVDEENVNVNRKGRYPVLWVKVLDGIEQLEKKHDSLNELFAD